MRVSEVLGVGLVVGAGTLAMVGLKKQSTAVRIGGTVAAIAAGWVGAAALSFAAMGKSWDTSLGGRRGLRGAPPPMPTSYYDDAPQSVHDLPFNLLRDQTPLDSPVRVQAMEQYIDGQPDVIAMLPKNFGFTRWRQGGGEFGSSIEALVGAVTQRDPLLAELTGIQDSRTPHMSRRSVARELNVLPNTGSPLENPISRGIPQQPVFTNEQLHAIANGERHIPVQESPFDVAQESDPTWIRQQLRQVRRSVRE
jgi:hypothetical protein